MRLIYNLIPLFFLIIKKKKNVLCCPRLVDWAKAVTKKAAFKNCPCRHRYLSPHYEQFRSVQRELDRIPLQRKSPLPALTLVSWLMERVLWRGDLLFCFKTQSKNTLLPLDQFSSTELSEMMEMFYICTVGSNSHSPPTKSHVWLVAIMFDDTNLDTQIYIQTILF